MSISNVFLYSLVLIGPFSLIFMIMNAINGLRDSMKMRAYANIAKVSTCQHGSFQMLKLGIMSMLCEGDTMRSSSAILGFTNGRVISQPESVVAMLSSSVFKAIWIWVAGAIFVAGSVIEHTWMLFATLGFVIILLNISNSVNLIGRFLFFMGMLLLAILLASSGLTAVMSKAGDMPSSWLQYFGSVDIVGIILSAFIGIFVGAIISGNLLTIFIAFLAISFGIACPECAVAFAIGSEIGTLFPMSFMVADTNLPARRSFLFYGVLLIVVLILDILILLFVPISFISELGTLGFILEYTLLYSVMLPIVYYLFGAKVWSQFSPSTHDELSSKRHLHQFDKIYRPHVSLMFIQAEKEIVNLQHRIHKMLDFIIDILDDENIEASLEHVRKYRGIVYRTGNEITDFILVQTSEKTNEHISDLARERLQAVSCQCQLGSLFCDLAEAVYRLDVNDRPIIRRCVVSLETLYNQVTKLIDSRYNVSKNEANILDNDVEILSLQLKDLLNEYGKDAIVDVLPYTIEKSKEVIIEIIKNLK